MSFQGEGAGPTGTEALPTPLREGRSGRTPTPIWEGPTLSLAKVGLAGGVGPTCLTGKLCAYNAMCSNCAFLSRSRLNAKRGYGGIFFG